MLIATGPGHERRLGSGEIADLANNLCASGRIKVGTIPKHAANMLTDKQLDSVPQDDVPVLTDDYAPVDMMVVEFDQR